MTPSERAALEAALRDFPQPGTARRWTPAEIDPLKALLNRHGLAVVSNAIGSLEFDLVDARSLLSASEPVAAPSPSPREPARETNPSNEER